MTNTKKLVVLMAVLFCFIIVLVGLLIYAKTTYNKNGNQVDTTTSTTTDVSQQSVSNSSEVQETIDLKLYFFDADDYDNAKEIRTVTVDKKLYQDDITAAINKVLESTNLSINKASISGNSITVDLPKEVALKFNSGTAGGITYTNILSMTILNLPNIKKMEVTVDGVAGVYADHFDFNGVFTKTKDGKISTFTESKNEGKELTY
jgi:hypothetical protein